jgi:hypothetical protein
MFKWSIHRIQNPVYSHTYTWEYKMQGYVICEQNNVVHIVYGTKNVNHLSWKRQQLYDFHIRCKLGILFWYCFVRLDGEYCIRYVTHSDLTYIRILHLYFLAFTLLKQSVDCGTSALPSGFSAFNTEKCFVGKLKSVC